MSESVMRGHVVKLLVQAGLDAIAVENPVCPGTPDVECLRGWIELKQLSHWPRTKGAVKIKHFRRGQRLWLRRRWHAGGACWLLLRVRSDWLLFDGNVAASLVGLVPREALFKAARAAWSTKVQMTSELPECLERPVSPAASGCSSRDAARPRAK